MSITGSESLTVAQRTARSRNLQKAAARIACKPVRCLSPGISPLSAAPSRARRLLGTGAFLVVFSAPASSAAQAPLLRDVPCDIPLAASVGQRLRCGLVQVAREENLPSSGHFDLAVVIRKSANPRPGAAPVLVLHGGPGGEMTRFMGLNPKDYLDGRDTISFDMRGGGRSTPRACDELGKNLALLRQRGLPRDALSAMQRELLDDCLARWKAAGFKAEHFGTQRNVDDAEAVRAALGISRWFLYGTSYGTVVAAHYAAQHPEQIEAAVLDSIYPPDDLHKPLSTAQAELLSRLGRECEADASCRGNTFASLPRLIDSLSKSPISVPLSFGATMLDGQEFQSLLHRASSEEAGVRSLPLILAAAERRDSRILGSLLDFSPPQDGGVNLAAALATDCRDRGRHHTPGLPDALELVAGLPPGACRGWTTPGTPPRWPEATSAPLLLLSGGYDAFQPDSEAVARRLGSSVHLVEIPFAAHGVRGAGQCPRQIVERWALAPTQDPPLDCLASMVPPPFLLEVVPAPGLARLLRDSSSSSRWPALVCLAGVVLSLLAGAPWSSVGALSRRWLPRSAPPTPLRLTASLAAASVALTSLCLAVALLWTSQKYQAALGFGLAAGWGWLRWIVLLQALAGGGAMGDGLRSRSVRALLAGGGALLAAGALIALGLTPWV